MTIESESQRKVCSTGLSQDTLKSTLIIIQIQVSLLGNCRQMEELLSVL